MGIMVAIADISAGLPLGIVAVSAILVRVFDKLKLWGITLLSKAWVRL